MVWPVTSEIVCSVV